MRSARAAVVVAASALLALAAGCAGPAASTVQGPHAMPPLRLAPALLGHPLDLEQHITVQAPGREQQLDVLLEADAAHVRLGVVALGQEAARLDWDGTTLSEHRAPWWPAAVSGARILSDLQLTLWPADAIRAALPPGWTLVEAGDTRTLSQDGEAVTVVTRRDARTVEIDQRRERYRLTIESRDLDDGATPGPRGTTP